MSRLIDKLNRVASAASQPMGFRASRPVSSEPRILLVASVLLGDPSRLADCIDGADAVLLHLAKSRLAANTIQKTVEPLSNIPWGGWLEDIGTRKIDTLVKAGCDFLVFPAVSLITAIPQDDKVGKILQVESSLDDGLLRAVNDLPVDAVLFTDVYKAGDSMAWHHLINIQRLANLLVKPLLIPVPLNVTASELKVLWEAGVDGVIVEADTRKPGALKELRQEIGKLPPRSSRKRGKAEALLPRVGGEEVTVIEEEEEEEE